MNSPDKTLKLIKLYEDDHFDKHLFSWLPGICRYNIDLTEMKWTRQTLIREVKPGNLSAFVIAQR